MKTTICTFLILFTWSFAQAETAKKEAPMAINVKDKALKWGPAPDFMPEGTQLAVLHGDPAKKNADLMIKFPGKSAIPNHWHSSAERMILVSGRMQVSYEGHKPVNLSQGSYAYGPAKLHHSAACESKEPCVLFIAFEGPVDAFPVEKHSAKK